jgi:hypothetical protein
MRQLHVFGVVHAPQLHNCRAGGRKREGAVIESEPPRKNSAKMQRRLRAGIATRKCRKASRNTWGSSNGIGACHAKAGKKSRLADKQGPRWQKRQTGSTTSPQSTLSDRMPRFFQFGKTHANFHFKKNWKVSPPRICDIEHREGDFHVNPIFLEYDMPCQINCYKKHENTNLGTFMSNFIVEYRTYNALLYCHQISQRSM